MNLVIRQAVALAGSQKKLADACGVSQPAVNKWLHNKTKVSPEYVHLIIEATKGKVQGHQIRPDLIYLFPAPNQAA